MMKRETKIGLLFAAGVGALIFFVEKARAAATPTIAVAAGIVQLPTPAGGAVHLVLPTGAREWALVTRVYPGEAPEQLALPAGAAPLLLTNVTPGCALTIAWHDALGNTQMAEITFT